MRTFLRNLRRGASTPGSSSRSRRNNCFSRFGLYSGLHFEIRAGNSYTRDLGQAFPLKFLPGTHRPLNPGPFFRLPSKFVSRIRALSMLLSIPGVDSGLCIEIHAIMPLSIQRPLLSPEISAGYSSHLRYGTINADFPSKFAPEGVDSGLCIEVHAGINALSIRRSFIRSFLEIPRR